MPPLRTYLSIILFLLFVVVFPAQLSAQNQVQIVRADSIVGGNFQGAPVQKILGDIHLRTEELNMFADSAYKFSQQDLVKAFGNIEIDTQEEIIWTDTLTYYTDIDFSELRGRVIIETDSTTLFGNSVDYRFTNRVAHFTDNIRLEDAQGTLIANSGFYFRRADSATFRGQVQLRDSLQYVEGDSLFSNRKSKYYELHGKVFADDPENKSMLKGDYLEADSTGRRLLKGNAWLKNYKEDSSTSGAAETDSLQNNVADSTSQFKPDSLRALRPDSVLTAPDSIQTARSDTAQTSQPDTTHIRAARILSLPNRTAQDTTTTIKAYENVRIWSPDFSSLSDSTRYKSQVQTFELWSNAKAWNKKTQLTGPYIWVQLEDGDIKQLDSYPNPFSVQQDTVINRLNQIKGDTLEATFETGQLSLIRVYPNSHLLRFTQENGKPDGALDLTAPVTLIHFENGELVELESLGKEGSIDGNYLPESEQIADRKLDGFSWNPELRPQEPTEIMKPRFPPIPKEPPFKLPRRYLNHLGQPDSLNTQPPDSSKTQADSLQEKDRMGNTNNN
jgi:hypothetical protein